MIYSVVEDNCYQRWTLGLAIPNFCIQNNLRYHQYHINQLRNYQIETNNNKSIFIIDAAFLQQLGVIKHIRQRVPNSKIVVLGSDSIDFINQDKNEFDGIEEVDLFLDTMEETVKYYKQKQIKSDLWIWSYSEYLTEHIKVDISPSKELDVCCLLRVITEYRRQLSQNLLSKHKCLFGNGEYGGGIAIADDKIYDIAELYNHSRIVLGTTSPACTKARTMKGFRDFLAPFYHSLLIYDNHPQILSRYFPNGEVDIYEYEDIHSLYNVIDNIRSMSRQQYCDRIRYQKECFEKKSIEKQLKILFDKYDLWV